MSIQNVDVHVVSIGAVGTGLRRRDLVARRRSGTRFLEQTVCCDNKSNVTLSQLNEGGGLS